MLRVALAALWLAAACANGTTEAGPSPTPGGPCRPVREAGTSPPPAGAVSCSMQARITVEVTGDRDTFTDEREVLVAINEFYEGQLPETTWFANLGIGTPAALRQGYLYRVTWDIAPGTYRGPKTYELTPTRPDVAGLSSPLTDRATVEITDLEIATPDARIYGQMAQPCTLEVGEGVLQGSLRCPELVAEGGQKVSLDFSWRPATPP